jgi:hypothetical protein
MTHLKQTYHPQHNHQQPQHQLQQTVNQQITKQSTQVYQQTQHHHQQETTLASMTYLLRTSLAKTAKERTLPQSLGVCVLALCFVCIRVSLMPTAVVQTSRAVMYQRVAAYVYTWIPSNKHALPFPCQPP